MRFLFLCLLVGCTQNTIARSFGGNLVVNVPCDEKVYDVTWKEESFWYASRPMLPEETPVVSHFREKSGFGVIQGEVTLVESFCRNSVNQ